MKTKEDSARSASEGAKIIELFPSQQTKSDLSLAEKIRISDRLKAIELELAELEREYNQVSDSMVPEEELLTLEPEPLKIRIARWLINKPRRTFKYTSKEARSGLNVEMSRLYESITRLTDEYDELIKKLDEEAVRSLHDPELKPISDDIWRRIERVREIQSARGVVLPPALDKKLRGYFENMVEIWRKAGIFSKGRTQRGYAEPRWEDYRRLVTKEQLQLMAEGSQEQLDKGYNFPAFTAYDVPLVSKNPDEISYLKLLRSALVEEFQREDNGQPKKEKGTIWLGPPSKRRILKAEDVDFDNILWQWEGYGAKEMVYNPQKLEPNGHGGISEDTLLHNLTGVEKKNGGVLRFEKAGLILPKHVGQNAMSAQGWTEQRSSGKIPQAVLYQNMKEYVAYLIQFLKTNHYLPDFWTGKAEDSEVVLTPGTYFPHEGSAGVVGAACWDMRFRQFLVGGNGADFQGIDGGVRGGVRISET